MKNQQGAPEALRRAQYLTVVYRDIKPGDEARELIMHPKMTAASWSHVMNERDRLAALVEAQPPATHVQNPTEIEHVAGDVSKNGAESNMAQQPAPSEQQPFGWIKQSEIDSSNDFGGSINLWRRKYDCDVPVYLAPQPSPTPQADSVLEDAARLEQIAEAIRDYHHALDMRKHGGLAESAAFSSICNTMGMHWNRGEEAARRAARKQGANHD